LRILLVVYDNDSFIHWFPQGMGYIAAVLVKEGFDVEIYSQDKFHWPEAHLTEYLDKNSFDVVGVGVIAGYYQYRKIKKISKAVNKSKNRPFYVIGGHGPSPEPAFFIKQTGADAVVLGEGEITIVELLKAVAEQRTLTAVKGIAFKNGDDVIINNPRELIQDIDDIPFPAYDLFPMDYYRLLRMPHCVNSDFIMLMLSGRGCTFECNFCYRMDKGFRPRSSESIIEEVKLLKQKYGITYIAFSDELLMSSAERTLTLCNAFIKANLGIKWYCNGRLNYAKPDVLALMKKAGCVFVNYGIEAMDDTVLRNMRKALSTNQIIKGIEATLAAGISPGFNIIFGNIGDNKVTLEKGVEFLLKYDDGAQQRTIRPVTPYPGSPLYYDAIKKGLLKDIEDFYERKHINSDLLSVNFTSLPDDVFHQCLFDANSRLLENYYIKHRDMDVMRMKKLYFDKDASFRGFR
jgi:anaerobic magnesium-protoporphyrin IX monomethyl ester cyclase